MSPDFYWGASAAVSLVVAVSFVRSWDKTKDRLFALFAAAFALLGVHWIVLAAVDPPRESLHLVYLLRLAAFLLIAVAILGKNRSRRR